MVRAWASYPWPSSGETPVRRGPGQGREYRGAGRVRQGRSLRGRDLTIRARARAVRPGAGCRGAPARGPAQRSDAPSSPPSLSSRIENPQAYQEPCPCESPFYSTSLRPCRPWAAEWIAASSSLLLGSSCMHRSPSEGSHLSTNPASLLEFAPTGEDVPPDDEETRRWTNAG